MEIDFAGARDGASCYRWSVPIDGGPMGDGVDWLENRLVQAHQRRTQQSSKWTRVFTEGKVRAQGKFGDG